MSSLIIIYGNHALHALHVDWLKVFERLFVDRPLSELRQSSELIRQIPVSASRKLAASRE